jgi:hypothetical protein
MTASRPKKLLVYLDQNFISEMAKNGHARVRPDFQALYSILQKGFWNEQLVVLRSVFHDIETSLAGVLADAIKTKRSTLGHVDLASPHKIRRSQLAASLNKHLCLPEERPVIFHEDAFDSDPDDRVGHLDINVNMDWMHRDAKAERRQLAFQLDAVRQQIRANLVSYDDQLRFEIAASRKAALGDYYFYKVTEGETAADDYARFVSSDAYSNVPIVWLDVRLLTRLMTAHSSRTIKEGDVTDIDAMATYLPYCDIYGADRFMAEVARSLKVPERYNCLLFDSSKNGVVKLTEQLHQSLAAIAPVNVPRLSIFVTPAESIKAKSFEFFRSLGNQARMAENRFGEWIEVFGFDDGTMPAYAMRNIPGVEAPFYGLQDVLVIRCDPLDNAVALVEAAKKECRSTHFVLIDGYQNLPDDFIMQALATLRDGQCKVLGYGVYGRA